MNQISAQHLLFTGGIMAAMGVAGGAFGAHYLDMLTPDRLSTFETGMRYLVLHGVGIVAIATLLSQSDENHYRLAGILIASGAIIFALSLTVLVLLDIPVLGAVAPIGGLAMISGWLVLAAGAWRYRR